MNGPETVKIAVCDDHKAYALWDNIIEPTKTFYDEAEYVRSDLVLDVLEDIATAADPEHAPIKAQRALNAIKARARS